MSLIRYSQVIAFDWERWRCPGRADKIREARVRKRIFETVKAVGAASHAEMMGDRK
jgi:hypothetical protein